MYWLVDGVRVITGSVGSSDETLFLECFSADGGRADHTRRSVALSLTCAQCPLYATHVVLLIARPLSLPGVMMLEVRRQFV